VRADTSAEKLDTGELHAQDEASRVGRKSQSNDESDSARRGFACLLHERTQHTKRRMQMNDPDDDCEPELHLWAEFNLPAELLHLPGRRSLPLGRALERGRSSLALGSGGETRDDADAESIAPFAVGRSGLA
jgi:hypothetical protein